ncbi:TPA: DUF551 domain-containing protein [Escherichia coli]|nr:DUF551 domain-containing protein [Escherichia coli]
MTTITKERIELFIKNPLDNGLTRGEQMELARIALASLEAEPVGAFHIAEQQVDSTSDYLKDGEWPIDNGIIEVYAAPPVPVVPEEKPMPNALSMLEREITQLIGDAQEATVTGYELIAEAWRLMDGQDPKTSDWHSKASKYLNSNIVEKVDDDRIDAIKAVLRRLAGNYPVTPDGWISCSERMPDDGQHVIILCDGAFVLYAQYRDGEFFDIVRNGDEFFETQSRNVTHWMPLPEPPQEVNRG